MLRLLTACVLSIGVLAMATAPQMSAADKKEEKKAEKLTGTITCAKCDLKVEGQKTCATVIKVGEKVYWFDEKSSKANHKKVCTEPMEGSVTGVVGKDGDKDTITVTKVEFKK